MTTTANVGNISTTQHSGRTVLNVYKPDAALSDYHIRSEHFQFTVPAVVVSDGVLSLSVVPEMVTS